MKRIMITGGTGRLGRELIKVFPDSLHPSKKELDITDQDAVYDLVRESRPELIIHCAAVTGIRECEQDKPYAWKVNVKATEDLLGACKMHAQNCFFVYISTACVFPGDRGDYVETDVPYPKNFYALTKLLGEAAVRYSGLGKWLILRTNFVAREKWQYPKAFIDRFGTYLFADDLALAISSVIAEERTGIAHICGEEKLSMFELAKLTQPKVGSMTIADYQGPPLTMDMSLRSSVLKPFRLTR
jgi:dTDP-4-dehydrorhamnose reductase